MSTIWFYIFIVFIGFDLLLTFVAKQHGLKVKNVYYQLNEKYGYSKVVLVKVGLALLQIWFIFNPGLNISRIEIAVFLYCLLVIKMFIDIVQSKWERRG